MKSIDQLIDELNRRISILQDTKKKFLDNSLPTLPDIEIQTEIYNNLLKFIKS